MRATSKPLLYGGLAGWRRPRSGPSTSNVGRQHRVAGRGDRRGSGAGPADVFTSAGNLQDKGRAVPISASSCQNQMGS
jgi:hypothetical protein